MGRTSIIYKNYDKSTDVEKFIKFYNHAHSDFPKHNNLTVDIAQQYIFGVPGYDSQSHFLAIKDSEIVGSVKGEVFAGKTGIIGMIVSPEYRMCGVEDTLYDLVMNYYGQKGLNDARVLVDSTFPKMIAFYKSRGFYIWRISYHMSCNIAQLVKSSPQIVAGYNIGAGNPNEMDNIRDVLTAGFQNEHVQEIISEFNRLIQEKGFDINGLIVARKDNAIVGMIFNFIHPAMPKTGYVTWISVIPSERNKGLGKHLLSSGLSWMRDKGALTAELNVDLKNSSALKLYQSCGFEVVSETNIMQKAHLRI